MERNYELRVACTLHRLRHWSTGPQTSRPVSNRCTRERSSHGEFARLVAVAARVPLLPSQRLELLALRVPHFGEHLGTCSRVRARAPARVRVVFFAHTFGLSAASKLGHEHAAVFFLNELALTATQKPETREPTAL